MKQFSLNWITNPNPGKKSIFTGALILFIGALFYYGLYIQGIPYEQEEGITRGWYEAANSSWYELFSDLLSPKSNEIKADGTNLITVRVTESVAHKLIYVLFGQSMAAMSIFYILVTAIFAVFVFLLAFKILDNLLIAFLTAAYLLLMPAYGWNSMEFGSYSPLDQLLLVAYVLLFAGCFQRIFKGEIESDEDSPNTFLHYFGLWFVGMCAIRAKEPNIFLVPALSWLMIAFNPAKNIFRATKTERKNLLGLVVIVFLLTLPMLWANKHPTEFNPFWDCPLRVFMWNKGGWEPELTPCLFTLERTIPVSVLANFGFFLGWIMIGTAVVVGIDAFKKRSSGTEKQLFSWPILLLVWFVIGEAFFIHYCSVQFIRHQAWILLPFTILVALLFKNFTALWSGRVAKTIVILALLGFTVEKAVDNVSHSIFVRQHLERLWVTKWEFREAIYKDLNKVKEAPVFDLYHYWQFPTSQVRRLAPFLESEKEKTGLLQGEEFKNYVEEFKTGYVVSPKPIKSATGFALELIHQIDLNKMSWLTTLKKRKRDPRPYYLYRVIEAS